MEDYDHGREQDQDHKHGYGHSGLGDTMTNLDSPILTPRLSLRRPELSDAGAIFENYAADPEAVKYMAWPRHRNLEDSIAFILHAIAEWEKGRGVCYLITDRETGVLLGSTGLDLETPLRASTGYILRKDAWGRGYATEALNAMVELASNLSLQRLQACCHTEHLKSARVLEKCGFEREGTLRRYLEFPNLAPGAALDVFLYSRAPAKI